MVFHTGVSFPPHNENAMRHFLPALGAALVLSLGAHAASAQQAPAASATAKPVRDPFFWLGEIKRYVPVLKSSRRWKSPCKAARKMSTSI